MVRRRRERHPALLWLGLFWALPLTLFGAVPAIAITLRGGRCRRVDGTQPAWLIQGPLADWLLERHPVGAVNAMAIGHLIIAQHDGATHRIVRHELEHVRQAARWGLFFPLVYLAASAWAALRGGRAYWDNYFEVAARQAEID